MRSLAERLRLSVGSRQAGIEIKWMRQAAGTAPHALRRMLRRRAHGEPLQYILGNVPFGPLTLRVRPPTLIPRPETEQWTGALAHRLAARQMRFLRILDLCTGSGCIPLLLTHLLDIQGIHTAALGVDISHSACQLARDNYASTPLCLHSSLDIRQIDLFSDNFWQSVATAFRGPTLGDQHPLRLDVVTANPPYIPRDQWLRLPAQVKNWEDPVALLGDPFPHGGDRKGLAFYRRIRDLLSAPGVLSQHAVLAMEIGHGQAADVLSIFGRGFGTAEVWKDWWGKERAIFIFGKE